MSSAKPSLIVTVAGENLDLYKPRQADRFLSHYTCYASAERAGLVTQYILADRIVHGAIARQRRRGGA